MSGVGAVGREYTLSFFFLEIGAELDKLALVGIDRSGTSREFCIDLSPSLTWVV